MRNTRPVLLGLFFILFIGSVFYAEERMLFCDASYVVFDTLNWGMLKISDYRYGSFPTKLVLLVACKLQLPLKTILILYSASFNAFYLGVAAIIILRFRNYMLAVLMALYYTLFAGDTYYWTNNEVHQGIAWMFLLFALVMDFKKRPYSWWLHVLLFAVLANLSIVTHPLLLIVIPFLWLFVNLDEETRPYPVKKIILLSGVMVLVLVGKLFIMQLSAYDSEKSRNATHFSFFDIGQALSSAQTLDFLKRLLTDYYFIPVVFFWGIYSAARAHRYRHIALTIFFALGYFIAMRLTFPEFIPFYAESEWMSWTVIVSILFVRYTLPTLKPAVALSLLSFMFLVRLFYIGHAAQKFTDRKNWIYATLQDMREHGIYKGYLYSGNPQIDNLLIMSWGVPTESMLASALSGDKPCRNFIVNTPEHIDRIKCSRKEIFGAFENWDNYGLNQRYFSIDTTQDYVPIGDYIRK